MVTRDELRERFISYSDDALRTVASSDDYSEDAHEVARQILAERATPYRGLAVMAPGAGAGGSVVEKRYDPRGVRASPAEQIGRYVAFAIASAVVAAIERGCH